MLNGHLSDEQVQELALGNAATPQDIVSHAEACADCKLKVHNYRLLINAVERQPAAAFDFDLAAAVVAQIETPPPKSVTNGLWWLFGITLAAIVITALVYFSSYMTVLSDMLKSLAIYLAVITGIVLAIMLAIDQLKTYQKKMKLLDMQ